MPTAHLIHGYLGVGKTSLACRLERELPAIRFTHDEWMARLYGFDPPAGHFADYAERVSVQIEAVWTRCLALGLDVVLDLNFWTRRGRDAARLRARSLGAAVRLYRVSCPEEIAWLRIAKRNAARGANSLFIARETFKSLRAGFEPLGDDEEREEVFSTPPDAPTGRVVRS